MSVTKYFYYPWAVNGDLQAGGIPNPESLTGYVSYQQGFTFDYQRDLATDAQAKSIQRVTLNSAFNDVTVMLQQLQQNGAPDWITAAANGSVSFPYDLGAFVRWSSTGVAPFKNYISAEASNTNTPGADISWIDTGDFFANMRPASPVIFGQVFGPGLDSSTTYTLTGTFTPVGDGWVDVTCFIDIPGVTDAFFGCTWSSTGVSDVVSYANNNVQQFNASPIFSGKVASGVAVTVSVAIVTQAGAINPDYYIGANGILRFTPAGKSI